jgi:hypothetical protein
MDGDIRLTAWLTVKHGEILETLASNAGHGH